MRNAADSSGESSFNLEGLVSFSTYAVGAIGVLIGRFCFGLDWTVAAFLAIPFHGLACGIVNNEPQRMVGHAVSLLFFPVAAMSLPAVLAPVFGGLADSGVKATPVTENLIRAFAFTVLFVILSVLSCVVARCIGGRKIPEAWHDGVVRGVVIFVCAAVLLGLIGGMRGTDSRFLVMTPGLRAAIAIVFGVAYVFCVRGVMRAPLVETSSGGSSKSGPGMRLVHCPNVRMSDVAGMEDVKRQIRLRLIEPVRDAARARQYGIGIGGGMLLYGPPGTGKTFIAKAVAGELGLPFFIITAADVFGKYIGESERNIRRIFTEVRKHPLSVVFIDELETLFPKRTHDVHETTRKVISILLQELDGIDSGKNPVLLLGATNVPWMIDEAFMRPGRFDVKVYVGLPDFDARRQMLIAAFDEGNIPHEPGLTAHIAERTEGYSGADLRGMMARMRQQAFDRRLQKYTYEFADEVLATSSPTTNAETVRRIREWEQT